MVAVVRRSARAILFDSDDRLVLIRRTKPNQRPYWTTPGGGVEEFDTSVEATVCRELREELGATVAVASQVFMTSALSDAGVAIQYFWLARLLNMDNSTRTGREFSDRSRGRYDVDRIDPYRDELRSIDLRPEALRQFIVMNHEALLATLALLE